MKRKLVFFFLSIVVVGSLVTILFAKEGTNEFGLAVPTFEEENLDPVGGTNDCKWYQTLIYDSLVGIEPPSTGLSTKTGIAYRWEPSPDYKHWTFYLRKGIKFHNGDELTAEDVKYTLDRALGPVSRSTNKPSLQNSIDSVEMVDKYTIIIHCKKPDSLLPMEMSEHIGPDAMIVPMNYIKQKGDDHFKRYPIGTGPYKLKEHVQGSYMLLEAVDKHWALGVPKYKYVRLLCIPEYQARIGLLKRGEVDMIAVPLEMANEVKSLGFPIVTDPALGVHAIITHKTWDKNSPLSDIRVREALNISIDREAIHKYLFAGFGKSAIYMLGTPASIGYDPVENVPYPYNPERANALLKEAGYGPNNPCKIPVYSFPMGGFGEAEKVIETCTSYWKKVGFDITIQKLPDYGVLRKRWGVDKTLEGSLSPNTIGGRVWSMPVTYAICHTKGGLSVVHNPEFDSAIEDALSEVDPKKRAALAHKAFKIAYDNYIMIPLIEAVGLYGVSPKTVPDWKNWDMGVTLYDLNWEWVLFPR